MSLISLDEVERYLVKRANIVGLFEQTNGLEQWVRDGFAELRARGQAKDQDQEAKIRKLEKENPE